MLSRILILVVFLLGIVLFFFTRQSVFLLVRRWRASLKMIQRCRFLVNENFRDEVGDEKGSVECPPPLFRSKSGDVMMIRRACESDHDLLFRFLHQPTGIFLPRRCFGQNVECSRNVE